MDVLARGRLVLHEQHSTMPLQEQTTLQLQAVTERKPQAVSSLGLEFMRVYNRIIRRLVQKSGQAWT